MRKPMIAVALAFLGSLPCVAQESVPKDSAAIYNAFLAGYGSGSHTTLNIANRTDVFGPDLTSESATSCLKEIHIETAPGTQIHALDASILPNGLKARLISPDEANRSRHDPGDAIKRGESVDDAVKEGFAAGVLTLSEVVFNADHTRAVMGYSFICGRLCGHGGAVLFQSRGGKWSKGKRVCGQWIL